ncbi:MAG: gliding motility-associated ABC transporter substrate-binding protein GldG [Saprospiraceae bacterium]
MKFSKKIQSYIQLALLSGVLILINILGSGVNMHLDLTEEKRFTLTKPTKELLKEVKDVMYVKVLLEGEFPAGFKRLQSSVREMLDDLRTHNGNIEYTFEDQNQGSNDEINKRRKQLAEDGIVPMQLTVKSSGETERKVIYPYAIFSFGNRSVAVNLLENQVPGQPQEITLNNSISTLEYKFANAIQKILFDQHPKIAFTKGHQELDIYRTADLERSLRQNSYSTERIILDSVAAISKDISVLVIAKPKTAFSEKDKFKIDQYAMNGGKVMWLIDRLSADMDSLQLTNRYIPHDYPLNLEDLLFKYGARIQPNLVLDLECARIPLRVGQTGQGQQFEMFPWYYHPLSASKSTQSIVKNLDRIWLQFPGTVDTIKTKTEVKKTVLLSSSDHSRLQFSPVELNFEILRYDADPAKFDKKSLPMAVLLEGSFPSLYENRVSEEMINGLKDLKMDYKTRSPETKMLVVSDGDIAANSFDSKNQVPNPLGYNVFMKYTFANKDFLMNAIEYMLDNKGVIESRSKEVKLRLMDDIRMKKEQTFWQFINIAVPLILLAIFGFVFNYLRKKRYTQ